MNPSEVLRIVDVIHRDKNIDKEVVFFAIESAIVTAVRKHYGDEEDVEVTIAREDGTINGMCNGVELDAETLGRIAAQTAKQVIIQKIREAERDALYDEYDDLIGQMISGVVQRYEGGMATVQLSNVEALLPRSEQIPGETYHNNERVRTVVAEVRKQGSRVKVILSRTRAHLVQRLFEQEIPEIADGVIEVRAISREPGYRTKVAVSSSDQRIDCVGACVGVRGNRIKNIVDELSGERIDIVRWSDDLPELIGNSLQPAEVDDVILCQMLGRAIVMVREDQLSLAIGRRGQNVRLASKLCGWDIEIMTREELDEQIDQAVTGFSELDGVDESLALKLVEEGYMSYDDLSVIEPDDLVAMGELTTEQVDAIVEQAEVKALEAEKVAAEQRRLQRQQKILDEKEAAAAAAAGEKAESTESTEQAEAETIETDSTEDADSEDAGKNVADEKTDDPGESSAVSEEAVSEETVSEEAVVDELPTEETPTEETPIEKTPIEKTPDPSL